MEKTVNIIGLGFGAIDAPWGNTDEHFWGINNAYMYGKLDKIFVMHSAEQTIKSSLEVGRNEISFRDAFKKYPEMEAIALAEFIYVYKTTTNQYGYFPVDKLDAMKADPDYEIITKTTQFPLKKATTLMGALDFTSTVAYIFAMAILEGFNRIRLYGFEVWSGCTHEYKFEAPCIERWQKLAKGRGIKTDISFDVLPPAIHNAGEGNNMYGYLKHGVND